MLLADDSGGGSEDNDNSSESEQDDDIDSDEEEKDMAAESLKSVRVVETGARRTGQDNWSYRLELRRRTPRREQDDDFSEEINAARQQEDSKSEAETKASKQQRCRARGNVVNNTLEMDEDPCAGARKLLDQARQKRQKKEIKEKAQK
jgi:hypothetical protein